MTEIIYFLLWTLLLYLIHRIIHNVPYLKEIHLDHHKHINANYCQMTWHWNNLFLFNDNWISTLDLWITEVLPTMLFSYITGHWWILCFYYIWAALIQEKLEHNPKIDLYPFTSGKWHLVHHRNFRKNYGLFHPFWDRIFRTELL
jgi:sterol desaturase/sphingolipid hydroxylase (fatty acid hydroxylase superfamily)